MNKLVDYWNRTWFVPTSPSPICAYRILFGAIAFAMGLGWLHDLEMWFGEHGVVLQGAVKSFIPEPRLSLFSLVHMNDFVLNCILAIYLLAALSLSIGFRTKISALIIYLLMASFEARNPFILTSGDRFMRIIAFLMIFSPAGKMYSADSLMRKTSDQNHYCIPWVQYLIRLQMAALYWHAFWNKLFSCSWQNGTAAYYSIMYMGQCPTSLQLLLHHVCASRILTWGTLVIEFLLWSLIWIRAFRYWVILVGVIFHISIAYLMGFHLFQWIMISCYINFVDPTDVESAFTYGKKTIIFVYNSISKLWNRYAHLD